MKNRRYLLKARPQGTISDDIFAFTEQPIPYLKQDEVLVRNQYLSLDPTHRIWMSDRDQYMEPIALGDVVRALGVGVVEESKHAAFAKGDLVTGLLGWQDYSVNGGGELRRLPADYDIPSTAFLSVLGLTGCTAYFGLLDVMQMQAGQTLVVSGAAGAVGSIVGQIAHIKGLRVVGIAGAADKCAWLTRDLGFDAAINYRTDDVAAALKTHCPKGIDGYFDNVGGKLSETVWSQMNLFGQVAICGQISSYNDTGAETGPSNFSLVLMKRLAVKGFIVLDYMDRWPEAMAQMYAWIKEGRLTYREDIVEGLEHAPKAVNKLFDGSNTGKLILKV